MSFRSEKDKKAFILKYEFMFEIKPSMTAYELYNILQSENFNEHAAFARIWTSVTQSDAIINLSDTAAEVIDPANLETTKEPPPGSQERPLEVDGNNPRKIIAVQAVSARRASEPFVPSTNLIDILDDSDDSDAASSTLEILFEQIKQSPARPTRSKVAEKDTSPTTVTQWIGRLAGALFVRTVLICDGIKALDDDTRAIAVEDIDADVDNQLAALIDITTDPDILRREAWTGRMQTHHVGWIGEPMWRSEKAGKIGYKHCIVDGTKLCPGDFVAVRPPANNEAHATVDNGLLAAGIWFARIMYLFSDSEGVPSAHLRWFAHGGTTILGETAGPRELFMLSECNDEPLGAIANRLDVEYVGIDEARHRTGLGAVELDFQEKNHFFYRLFYSGQFERFEEIGSHADAMLGHHYCTSCEEHITAENQKSVLVSKGSQALVNAVTYHNHRYTVNDFVYVTPSRSDEPYIIGQIRRFKQEGMAQWIETRFSNPSTHPVLVEIDVLRRYDDLLIPYFKDIKPASTPAVRDCRRLFFTGEAMSIPAERLDGNCFVRHGKDVDKSGSYKDFEDTFYVSDHFICTSSAAPPTLTNVVALELDNFQPSLDGDIDLALNVSKIDAFLSQTQKLRAMEVFAGAGGLSAGLEQSHAIDTKWAIEWDTLSAQTYSRNNPSVIVYNEDANTLLKRALDEENGIARGQLRDKCGLSLPRMPSPGQVEFLYGGPPCQDFSAANQYRKSNSIKNSLLATYLSYVDYYRPKYFLLENVRGLLAYRLGSSQVNIHRTKGGIHMGAVKFILRALTSLGYQAQFGIVSAVAQGTPQQRARVFFWGSAPGFPLPAYPEPSHILGGTQNHRYSRHVRRSAPHRAVSVGDAITDLAPFDCSMRDAQETSSQKSARLRRSFVVKQVVPPQGAHARIGFDAIRYECGPLSEYQRQIRKGRRDNLLSNHFTQRFNDETLLRVRRIPMKPGASHLDLPASQDREGLRGKTSKASKHNFYPDRYQRLDFDKPFQTCLTSVDPGGKNGKIIHPNQHRVLTVREQARAQGFPDTFTWDVEQGPKAMYKQIGNAVAIPVGKALGRELLKVVVEKWEKDQGRTMPVEQERVLKRIETDGDDCINID